MWFDAKAKLAEIVGDTPATSATTATQPPPVSQLSQVSQAPVAENQFFVAEVATPSASKTETGGFWPLASAEVVATIQTSNPEGDKTPRVAEVASVAMPLTDAARARVAALPTAPPTCAVCGVADWHVSLTDARRRTLHVACWRAEHGTNMLLCRNRP